MTGTKVQRGRNNSGLHVCKYQALGNSYLVLDPLRQKSFGRFFKKAGKLHLPKAEFVRVLCDEAWGIGANGILYGPCTAKKNIFALRIINSDGTPSGFSGNGVRIFARYLLDAGYVSAGMSFLVETIESANGSVKRNLVPVSIAKGQNQAIQVSVPLMPVFGAKAVDANSSEIRPRAEGAHPRCSVLPLVKAGARLTGSSRAWADSSLVYIGNPHCVTFVRSQNALPTQQELRSAFGYLRDIAFRPSRKDRKKSVFGNGSNLQWAHVRSRSRMSVLIFERGEGPTLASGSSAIAAASAAYARGLIGRSVEVTMPGGSLHIEIADNGQQIRKVTLFGSAIRIFEGQVDRGAISAALSAGTHD